MKIGIPKEIKNRENRVGLTVEAVSELVRRGHRVFVEKNAGAGIASSDAAYRRVGATILKDAKEVFARAEMIVKVKEPQKSEIALLRPDQILFTYLHLAADKQLTAGLMKSRAVCIAYEMVTDSAGRLPLLSPMSQVAGRLAPQVASHYLFTYNGGIGRLMGGVPGVLPAQVLVLGGGIVGRNATKIAVGMGADVTVVDQSPWVMNELHREFGDLIRTLYSTKESIAEAVKQSDVVIGGVLLPGASAPKIVSEAMVRTMRTGSVIVDVAIDQGGCIATARPTTHSRPVYIKHGVVHYCVTNMPGAVPRTSTYALSNVTLPYVLAIADRGWQKAVAADQSLRAGVSVCGGRLTCAKAGRSLRIKTAALESVL